MCLECAGHVAVLRRAEGCIRNSLKRMCCLKYKIVRPRRKWEYNIKMSFREIFLRLGGG
jgi:hypothetical protein